MKITTFQTGAFLENAYLVVDEATGAAALVDPGDDGDRIADAIQRAGVSLEAIWITHAHLDHIGGVAAVKRRFDVPVWLYPLDLDLYRAGDAQAAQFGVPFEQPPDPERAFADGDVLPLGTLRFRVMHAPGHSPGHVVIHGQGVAFVGDCLFAGSIGRTDLPGASGAQLELTLRRIVALSPETRVLPGHGPTTTVEAELATNPFLTGTARPIRR